MVDPMVQELLEQAIDSPVKLHLFIMFYENPRMEATARAIADRVCRDMWSVSQALSEMSHDGIMLISAVSNGEPVYRYDPVQERLESIERLVSRYDDPMERDLLHRSIRDLAAYAIFRHTNVWETQVA